MENIAQAIPDFVGLTGMTFILGIYFLLQMGKLSPKDTFYSVGNLIGATLLLVSLFFERSLPPTIVMYGAWIIISAYGIFKSIKTNQRKLFS